MTEETQETQETQEPQFLYFNPLRDAGGNQIHNIWQKKDDLGGVGYLTSGKGEVPWLHKQTPEGILKLPEDEQGTPDEWVIVDADADLSDLLCPQLRVSKDTVNITVMDDGDSEPNINFPENTPPPPSPAHIVSVHKAHHVNNYQAYRAEFTERVKRDVFLLRESRKSLNPPASLSTLEQHTLFRELLECALKPEKKIDEQLKPLINKISLFEAYQKVTNELCGKVAKIVATIEPKDLKSITSMELAEEIVSGQ